MGDGEDAPPSFQPPAAAAAAAPAAASSPSSGSAPASGAAPTAPAANPPAAAAAPTAEGGGGSDASPLEFLRNQEMFQQMRQLLQQNPSMLNAVLQQLRQSNPELLNLISQNQEAFIRMINEPDSAAAGGGGSAGGGGGSQAGGPAVSEDMPGVIAVSQQDKEAIERVSEQVVFSPISLISLWSDRESVHQ